MEAYEYQEQHYEFEKYPSLMDIGDEFKAGSAEAQDFALSVKEHQIVELEVENEFRDDHEECVEVAITLENGRIYRFGDWWISRGALREYLNAEGGKKKALRKVRDRILEEFSF